MIILLPLPTYGRYSPHSYTRHRLLVPHFFRPRQIARESSLSRPELTWLPRKPFFLPFNKKCISDVERIDSIIIFHPSKWWKAKFVVLCDVIFLVRLQEKFEIYLITLWSKRSSNDPNVLCSLGVSITGKWSGSSMNNVPQPWTNSHT